MKTPSAHTSSASLGVMTSVPGPCTGLRTVELLSSTFGFFLTFSKKKRTPFLKSRQIICKTEKAYVCAQFVAFINLLDCLVQKKTVNMSSKSGRKVLNKNFGRLSLRPLDNAGSKSGSKKKKRKLQPLRQSKDRSSDDDEYMDDEAVSESHPEEDSGSEAGGASDTTNQNMDGSAPSLSITSQKMMVAMFLASCVVASGLSNYLTSALGGGKTQKFVNRFAKQVLNLLSSTKEALDGTGLNMVDDKVFVGEVWSTALTIATNDMTSIADHLEELKSRGLKDNTLRTHVTTYKLFFYWFSYVFKGRNQYPVDAENKKMMEVVLSNLSRFYGKAAKVVRRKELQSIEEKVALKSWPEGGFEDLQTCLVPHIKALLAMDPAKIRVDEESYRHFKQVLVAGLYAFSVQGRIGGVKSILLRQAGDLIANGK